MTNNDLSKEEQILRVMKRVLTDIAKDTVTPPGHKHPLSDQTIVSMRDCLSLITVREAELALEAGRPSKSRPRYVDEPQSAVVVKLHKSGVKPGEMDDQ
jgi:hypothetical protein